MEGLLDVITSFNNFQYVPVSGWQIYFAHFNSNSFTLEFVIQKLEYICLNKMKNLTFLPIEKSWISHHFRNFEGKSADHQI